MNQDQKLEVFQAQVRNTRELDQAWKHLKRSINLDLISNNHTSARIHTKTLALIYCAWTEAVFSKLIHTPYGFDLDEIGQIKIAQRASIVNAWNKCIELALAKVGRRDGSYIPNIRQRLQRLINEYIETPSLIRNKIAHGQWVCALNRENTSKNNELTFKIADLDIVKLDILKQAFQGTADIVEAMIESPERAFHRDYWPLLTKLEEQLQESQRHTLTEKIARLKSKASRTTRIK